MSRYRRIGWFFCAAFFCATCVRADSSFDLDGPQLHVKVTRGQVTLPIAQVPNLQPADQIWLRPETRGGESIHYVLVVAFLRGSTNPPPDKWFFKAELWKKAINSEGIRVTVPADAEQALLLMAPDTGGGFSTIRSAVESEPGVFVRAAVDLNQATLDRSRVDAYLSAVESIANSDPDRLEERSKLLARSLGLKIDTACFSLPTEQQATCLTKNKNDLVLDDGHTQSVVAAMTTGTTTDLFNQISNSRMGGGGAYSPYVGAIVDVAHLMASLHTADYQYIPALSVEHDDLVSLKLNRAPSFRKPKSVLVISLPMVQSAKFPPLRAVDAKRVDCLQAPKLLFQVEGAPLVFSNEYAHAMHVEIASASKPPIELPASPDAERGGYVIDNSAVNGTHPHTMANSVIGKLRGSWGFDEFNGPELRLTSAHPSQWKSSQAVEGALVVGQENIFSLESSAAACVEHVTLLDGQKKTLPVTWKRSAADALELHAGLQNTSPGPITVAIQQYGQSQPDKLQLQTYAEAASLTTFTFHSSDSGATLDGKKLEEVVNVELQGLLFLPERLVQMGSAEQLSLKLEKNDTKGKAEKHLAVLQQGEAAIAHVVLKDGRTRDLPIIVQAPRPVVSLLGKSVQWQRSLNAADTQAGIVFQNQDDLPQNGRLTFFLKSVTPALFPRTQSIEVAAVDGSFHTQLSIANGTLVLQDARTVFADLDPEKSFGASAFGALQFRAVDADGLAGDWQPLANLVRVPTFQHVRCPMDTDKPCTLRGDDLFLLDSVAADLKFQHSVAVPLGFADESLSIPRPLGATLYIKLRDDPASVITIALPILPELQ